MAQTGSSSGGQTDRLRRDALGVAAVTFFVVSAAAPLTAVAGGYPIAIYHDANGDHDFNRTLFVPREGYGISNDVSASFGRPSFEKARVVVDRGNALVRIRMRYP